MLQNDIQRMARFVHIAQVNHSLYAVTRQEQQHDAHELVYVLTPGYELEVGGQILRLHPGEMLIIGRGVAHRLRVRPDNQTAIYVLQWSEPQRHIDGVLGPLLDADGRILVLLRWLDELAARPRGLRGLERDRRIAHLVEPVLDQLWALQQGEATSLSERILAAMAVDHPHPVTLSDLGDAFGLSPTHLARRFKAETGETPARALARIRLEHALSLLSGTDLPLAAIAARVGIGSPAHLSRLIKRHTGRSASQLRATRQCAGGLSGGAPVTDDHRPPGLTWHCG